MNRGNNYTVQQVLQRLQTDQLDDSYENEETELQDKEFVRDCYAGVESCDSDTDIGEDEESSAAFSIDFLSESDQSVSQNTAGQVNAPNGTVWKNITGAPGLGRASSSNVFSERPGSTFYCHRSVVNSSPYNAFHLFIDEHMLRCIQKHTINHGKKDNDIFDLHVDELNSSIGLQIARGVLVGKNTPVKQLWSKEWGQLIFRNTISPDRYQEIMKHLRFDDFFGWKQRRETDKFCLISEVWNCFIESCKKCYGWLWYRANGKPYLGRDPSRSRCSDLPGDVCLTFLQPYYKKGYNVTTDNYFTSLKRAEELKQKKTTILGTIRKQRREVPSTELIMKDKKLYASEIFSSLSGCSLTIYKAKKKKVVSILSSMHRNVNIDQCPKKKLPETIQYYNKSKMGVDVLDQMARYHTSKSSTTRWPVAVFFNILDCACINAYIIYRLTTKLKLSRRQFMIELIKELCKPKDGVGSIPPSPAVDHIVSIALPETSGLAQQVRKRKGCQFVACRNKPSSFCQNCGKVCCGKHTSEKVTIVKCKNCDD